MKRLARSCIFMLGLGAIEPAVAADFAPVPEPVPVFNWTGIYVGLAAGGLFGDADFKVKDCEVLCTVEHEPDGILAGGQIGGLYQFNQIVIGAEVQGLWTNAGESEDFFFGLVETEHKLNAVGSARGILGWAYDRALIYATGGWGFADLEAKADIPILDAHWSDDAFLDGFVVGAGAKYAVVDGAANGGGPSVIFGIEWLHYDLDNADLSGPIKFGNRITRGAGITQVCEYCEQPKLKVDSDVGFDTFTANVSIKF